MKARRLLLVMPVPLVLLAAGCTQQDVVSGADAVAEVAARNAATVAGEAAFVHEGVDVDGNLTCTADATNGVEQMTIACTGTSTDGRDLRLDGTVTSVEQDQRGGIQGTFTGTAGEETVFTTDCLGVGC